MDLAIIQVKEFLPPQDWKSFVAQLGAIVCLYTDIVFRLFSVMFTILFNQIEHLDNFSIQSYCVEQFYLTNEIIQFSERKLINKSGFEWYFYCSNPFYAEAI